METFRSLTSGSRARPRVRQELLVFAWNLRSFATQFERRSLALNTIEHGRAWHWGLLPAGWADAAFILRHGQIKTKAAFAAFFPRLQGSSLRMARHHMKIRKPTTGEKPVAWEKLKVVHFTDLVDAKISALSTRGFARDFVDLYTAHKQKRLDWRRLLARASRNHLNDYNPVELENNLRLIEQELKKGTHEMPCTHPPPVADLVSFSRELRAANANTARELARAEGFGDEEAR